MKSLLSTMFLKLLIVWIALGTTLCTARHVRADDHSELPDPAATATTLPSGNEYRVLFVGNSITRHSCNAKTIEKLKWDHVSGMAATSQEKDYVHLFADQLQDAVKPRKVTLSIVSLVAGGHGKPQQRIAPVVNAARVFMPHLVVVQHGEHEKVTYGADGVKATYNALLDIFSDFKLRPQFICVGTWYQQFEVDGLTYRGWGATVNSTLREVCQERKLPFVSVEAVAADPACHGWGEHPGVQWHPNDLGHRRYAELIFAAYQHLVVEEQTSVTGK